MSSLTHIHYVALADWIWQRGMWYVRKVAFCQVSDPDNTMVVMPTKESYGLFTFDEIVKNSTVHPLNGFESDYVEGAEYEIPMQEMESFLTGRFYEILQKDADTWKDITIGTFDMATFMFLEPMFMHKVVYLGPRIDAEQTVQMQVENHKN